MPPSAATTACTVWMPSRGQADDTHRDLATVRDENLGNRHRCCSDLKVVQRLPSHHRIPVFDMELHTYLFGVKDCMTSIRPNLAGGHRGLKAISPAAGDQ
jgi:hypothetical protein